MKLNLPFFKEQLEKKWVTYSLIIVLTIGWVLLPILEIIKLMVDTFLLGYIAATWRRNYKLLRAVSSLEVDDKEMDLIVTELKAVSDPTKVDVEKLFMAEKKLSSMKGKLEVIKKMNYFL